MDGSETELDSQESARTGPQAMGVGNYTLIDALDCTGETIYRAE